MSISQCKLHGIIPALAVPMNKNGDIEAELLRKQVNYLLKAGVHGLFVNGGTGEGAYLTTEEKIHICELVMDECCDKQFVCAACIRPDTRSVLNEMRSFEALKPDYFVATAPFYYKMTQKDLIIHFKTLAENAISPLIIYNIPSAVHNPLSLDSIYELSMHGNIVGVKDTSGDFMQFSQGLFGKRVPGFAWIQGEDYLCGPSIGLGADGLVTGLSNAKIEPYMEMYHAYEIGDIEKICSCQNKINRLYEIIHTSNSGNAAIKAVTEIYGRGLRYMRQFSQTVTDEEFEQIKTIMDSFECD